jgi:phage-related protein
MSITTLVTFVEVFSVDVNENKSTKHLLQNAKREPSENSNSAKNTISFNGKNYHYLPFVYQGTTINKSGDNIESNLVMANHPLSMAKAQEAVLNRYFVEVNVCIAANDDIDNITNVLTTDTWLAASLSYDPEVVEVLLSSAVDAVGVNVPSIVLTTQAVGKLPVSSDIQNR